MDKIWNILIVMLFAEGMFTACSGDDTPVMESAPEVYLNPDDSLAMVKVYEGLKLSESGQEWDLTDPDSWPGIRYDTIDNVAYINTIRINSKPMVNQVGQGRQAYLSPEIGKLKRLRHLSIRQVYLWALFTWDEDKFNCLTDELFELPLEELILDNVKNINPLDKRIAKFADTLKLLRISGCDVKELPEELAQLRNLESLDLTGNMLTGKVPDFMFRMRCKIYLYANRFEDLDWNLLYDTVENGYAIPELYQNALQGAIPEKFENHYWQEILLRYLFPQTYLGLTYSNGDTWPNR